MCSLQHWEEEKKEGGREDKKRKGGERAPGMVVSVVPGAHNVKAEGWEVEGHSPLHSEFKVNLGCMKFCLKDRGREKGG